MIIASIYHCPFDDSQITHDMSASIITRNNIYAYEEEKLTSTKNESTVKFPERSLISGLKELNITCQDITDWVFPQPFRKISDKEFKIFFCDLLKAKKFTTWKNFKKWIKNNIHYVPHHLSHASLAFYTSNFKNSAFVTKDGGGDLGDPRGFVFGEFNNGKISIISEKKDFRNLSLFHDYLTDSLGFSYFNNGKTSGLAAYGSVLPDLKKKLEKLLKVTNSGIIFNNKRYKSSSLNIKKFKSSSYERYKVLRSYPSDTNLFRIVKNYLPIDIAATGEQILKEKFTELLNKLKKKTNLENLVCSGGLFQNVSLNDHIIKSNIFKNCFFPMANSDAGLSLGAGLYVKHFVKNKKKKTQELNPYLGPSFSKNEIKRELDTFKLNYKYIEKNIEKHVAKKIVNGSIIGWFQGRGEYGPRSLGNRSILADPRKYISKTKVNQLLKKRDWFMPFAPSIEYNFAKKITGSKFYSGYMQVAFKIKKNYFKNIKAAIHYDASSRIHMVKKKYNPKYWKLLKELKKLIGVPVVLNTSFNRHGIATISSPRQAIEHALEGCMDYLILDNFIIKISENRKFSSPKKKVLSENKSLINDQVKRYKELIKKKIKFDKFIYQKYLYNLKKKLNGKKIRTGF